MNAIKTFFCAALAALVGSASANPTYRSGFFIPDSVQEITMHYKTVRNLIVLPMIINDSIHVNLILDTGCRTLVLFGNRFQKLLKTEQNKVVQFSGYGNGKPVFGKVSLYNQVSMGAILGVNIPLVIAPNKNMFQNFSNVHGIIGYDILTKFEIEIHPGNETITFRSAPNSAPPSNYEFIPLNVIDCRPVLSSRLFSDRKNYKPYDLMVDTGSAMSLLLRIKDLDESEYAYAKSQELVGLNGSTLSFQTRSNKLQLNNVVLKGVHTGIVTSPHKNGASIGMGILKNYIIIFNYCKSYVCLKKLSS